MHGFNILIIAAFLSLAGCSNDSLPSDDDDSVAGDDDDSAAGDDDDSAAGDDDDSASGDDDDATPGDDDDSSSDDDDDTTPGDEDGDGWTVEQGDCDDSDASAFPGNAEVECDGVDNDCSGDIEWEVPAHYSWIQDAMDAADDGDTVCVHPGTYIERLDFLGKAIRVHGVQGAESTVVDGFSSGAVVTFESGEGDDSVLSGLTITGGLTFLGGGIYIETAGPSLTGLILTGNEATEDGGAIYACSGSAFTLSDSVISDNVADDRGAGLYAVDSQVEMSNLSFTDNVAYIGAGVFLRDSVGEITDSSITDNTAGAAAGGYAYLSEGLDPQVLQRVFISGNTAGGCGGGLCGEGDVHMSDVTVADNETTWDGGGLHLEGDDVVLNNVLLVGNRGDEGGGLQLEAATASLTNVIVASNTALSSGGGIDIDCYLPGCGTSISLTNVIVAGNVAQTGGGIAMRADDPTMDISLVNVIVAENEALSSGGGIDREDEDTITQTLDHCDVWNNTPDDFAGLEDPTGIDGNVSMDPVFLSTSDPDPLLWDLHLSSSSVLVDAGDPTLLDPDGSPSDIGAYGGPAAGSFDLDNDGYPEWWQPGPYDFATYPGLGWDCDDTDASVHPGNGC